MAALKEVAEVETAYNGGFVSAINGVCSGFTKGEKAKVDWFIYVNGIQSNAGALDYIMQDGDVERWDFHNWDFAEVTEITSLQDKVVVDAGAGTGRVALEAAQTAAVVFAVEPVGRLRQFIRQKAHQAQLQNVHVLDGFNHAIPLPAAWVDVLITSHALGWDLEAELADFEGVVKAGGFIVHCPGTADNASEEEQHKRLISADWNYEFSRYKESDGWKRKYWKQL